MRYCCILCLMMISLISCKQDPKTFDNNNYESQENHSDHTVSTVDSTQPPLFNEVMAIHDIAMPKMSVIMDLKQKLRMKLDSIDALEDGSQFKGQFKHALKELNRADDLMTGWMNNFKNTYDSLSTEQDKMVFLIGEKERIQSVNKNMDNSINVAKQTLATTPLK